METLEDDELEGEEEFFVMVGGVNARASEVFSGVIEDDERVSVRFTQERVSVREGEGVDLGYEVTAPGLVEGEGLGYAFEVEAVVVGGTAAADFRVLQEVGLVDRAGRVDRIRVEGIADGLIEGSEFGLLELRARPLTTGFSAPLSVLEVGGSVRLEIEDVDAAEVRLSLSAPRQAVVGLGESLRVIEGTEVEVLVFLVPSGGVLGEDLEVRVLEGLVELPLLVLRRGESSVSGRFVVTEDTMVTFASGQGTVPGIEFGVGGIGVEVVDESVRVSLRVLRERVREGEGVEIEVIGERTDLSTSYPSGEVIVRGVTAEEGLDFFPLEEREVVFDPLTLSSRRRYEVRVIEDGISEDEESFEVYLEVSGGEGVGVEGGIEEAVEVRIEDAEEEEEEVASGGGGGGGIGPLFLILGCLGAMYRLCRGVRRIGLPSE